MIDFEMALSRAISMIENFFLQTKNPFVRLQHQIDQVSIY